MPHRLREGAQPLFRGHTSVQIAVRLGSLLDIERVRRHRRKRLRPDQRRHVPVEVTPVREPHLEPIEPVLPLLHVRLRAESVFQKQEPAARLQHPVHLPHGLGDLLNAAQGKRADDAIKGAILDSVESSARNASTDMASALNDLEALMHKATDMVRLAEELNEKLSSISQTTQSQQQTAAQAGGVIEPEEVTFIRSSLSQLGLQMRNAPVTLDMISDEQKWTKELARELAGILQGDPKQNKGMMKQRGIIGLDEVWGGWNRASGVCQLFFPFLFPIQSSCIFTSKCSSHPSDDPPSGPTFLAFVHYTTDPISKAGFGGHRVAHASVHDHFLHRSPRCSNRIQRTMYDRFSRSRRKLEGRVSPGDDPRSRIARRHLSREAIRLPCLS